jgi:hypothetical protein
MTVKGAFFIELSGPFEARAALLDAFARESIAARYIAAAAAGLDEEAKGWVKAEFHEGVDSPSSDFQQACLAKATTLGEQFGYQLRSHGVVIGGSSQLSHVVDSRSGGLVLKGFNLDAEALPDIARMTGIPVEFLELREPPGLWSVPEA